MSDPYSPPGGDGGSGQQYPGYPGQAYPGEGYPPAAPTEYGQPGWGAPPPAYPRPGYGQPGAPGQYQDGTGRTAMILGIIALFTFWIPLLYLVTALPMSIIAIVMGVKGRGLAARGAASNPGQALAGIICGSIAAVLCVLNVIIGILLSL